MGNLLVSIGYKWARILVKFRAQILNSVCVGCDQRKLFRASPVCAVCNETGSIRAPQHLGMFFISLALYCNLAVNVDIASIFQIRFPVKGKLCTLSGFPFG